MAQPPTSWYDDVVQEEDAPWQHQPGNRQRAAQQFQRPRRLLPEEFPSQQHLEQLLQDLSDIALGTKDPKRTHKPCYPAVAPDTPEFDSLRNQASIVLTEADLRVRRGQPSERQVELILRVLNSGRLKAIKRGYAMIHAEPQFRICYNPKIPDCPAARDSHPAVLMPNKRPVLVVARKNCVTEPVMPTASQGGGLVVLPASHQNDCRCNLAVINNNLDFLLYCQICLPKALTPEYEVRGIPDAQAALQALPVAQNASMLYFSYIAKTGTVTPYLTRRQPLSSIARGPVEAWHQPFAEIDLFDQKAPILASLMAQVERPDFALFVTHIRSEYGDTDEFGEQFRFPSLERQLKSLNISCRGT